MKSSVCICIPTYRRPQGLRRLLEGLERQTFTRCDQPQVEIVVVDNDAAGSAENMCRSLCGHRWPIKYFIEPRRGISFARNRAIDAVMQAGTEFMAFIDDDEVPEPNWLDELLFIQQMHRADMVFGPAVPYFDEPVPDWIIEGRFYHRPRHATGSPARGGTGNSLFRAEIFRGDDLRFDERYALSGGEDAHLFLRAEMKGCRAVWSDEAITHEWIPKSRANLRWLMRRSFRIGNTTSLKERELYPDALSRLIRFSKGIGRVAQGIFVLPVTIVYHKRALAKSLRAITYGVGIVMGQFGYRYQEYKVVHGD